MTNKENRIVKRRLANAWLSSVVSISLVLLLVGVAALLLLNTRRLTDYFKENVKVSVLLATGIPDEDALAFQGGLDSLGFVKNTVFISREQGRKEMAQMLGEDFLDVFEAAPIPVSIEVGLKPDYVSPDSLDKVKAVILDYPEADDVVYQTSLVEALNSNLGKIASFMGVLIVLLLFISYVLITNTMRLNVYARRFTIHTMKLVGATRAFIRGPFVMKAAFMGLISSLISILMLLGIMFVIREEFAQLFEVLDPVVLMEVMGIMVAAGLLICMASTALVVNRLVSLGKDNLYY